LLSQTPLSAADLRDPEISELIGKKLREFHDLMDPRTSHCGRGSGMHFFYVTFYYH